MATAQALITAEMLAEMPEDGVRRELVRGVIIEMSPVKRRHGRSAGKWIIRLGIWAESTQSGEVGTELGFVLARDPDVVRAPDAYFIRQERLEDDSLDSYWEGAPDLAVEVVSPSETATEVQEKVSDYLQGGTRLVWVCYPKRREVMEYLPDGQARLYKSMDVLTNEEVLPGFSATVSELFR